MIEVAKTWVGYLEHKSEDLLGVYTANVGKGYCTIFSRIISQHYRHRNFNGVPWCAVFVHAVFLEAYGKDRARKLLGKPHPGTRVLARRLKRKKRLRWPCDSDYVPEPGDLVFFHNGDGEIAHCGIVVEVNLELSRLTTVEGNTTSPTNHFEKHQGGAVAMRERNLSDPSIICYASMKGA